jgi:hypothetical protein
MDEKKAVRFDASLLAAFQRVFGADIVKSAYIVTYDFGRSAPGEVKKRLDEAAFRDDGKNEINYDAQEIMVEFCNGNKVIFQNSEWATIWKVTEEVYQA